MPPPTLEEIRDERRLKLEMQLQQDFNAIKKSSKVLFYGQSKTVKPVSFIKLDSLFNLKYNASQSGRSVPGLEEQIELQRNIVLSDTTELLYMETVWCQVVGDTAVDYLIFESFQNNQNVLRKITMLESFEVPLKDSAMGLSYFMEYPFLRLNGSLSTDERNFYGFMKNRAVQLTGDLKDEFIANVLEIMRIAQSEGTLSSEVVLKRLTINQLKEQFPTVPWTDYNLLAEKVNDGDQTRYEVTVSKKVDDGYKAVFIYDSFFFPIK